MSGTLSAFLSVKNMSDGFRNSFERVSEIVYLEPFYEVESHP